MRGVIGDVYCRISIYSCCLGPCILDDQGHNDYNSFFDMKSWGFQYLILWGSAHCHVSSDGKRRDDAEFYAYAQVLLRSQREDTIPIAFSLWPTCSGTVGVVPILF